MYGLNCLRQKYCEICSLRNKIESTGTALLIIDISVARIKDSVYNYKMYIDFKIM